MKRIKIVSVLIALLLAAIISGCIVHGEVPPDEKTGKKVLLIFSYHPEHPWAIEETRGAEDIFKNKGLETEKFYLDTKRKTSAEWKKKVSEDAVKRIEEFKPDLVIVFDDNACELVAMKYAGKALPFVFCGMNGDPEDYGFPAENIAGVVERQHINGTIDLLKQLVPDVKKAAIITDNSPSSHGFVTRIEKTALPVEICEIYTTDDFDAWKAKVKELQPKVDAIGLFVYHTIKDPAKAGEISLPPEDVLNWTLRNSKLPEFAFFDFTVRAGALCGVTLSGYEQGKAAAEIAIEILDGKKPADIPIKCPEKGNPMVNERRAEELNITVPTDIVKEVEIINGEDREKKDKKEPKEVRFGCALSLSGELEEEGCLTKEGYKLWKEHVNSQGGIHIGNDRYLIDILYYDDESNPQKTASLVDKLINEDKVDFLLGPYGSSATFEAAAVAEKYRVPMVEGEGSAEKIFTQGFKYTFGLLSSSRDYFQNILEGAASLEPKPNRVAILSTDVPYLYIAEGAEEHAKHLGFEVIPLITVEKGDDLSSILSDLKDDSPNMVLFSAPFGEALSFVKTAKAVGLSPNMFGIIVAPCDPAFVEQLGRDADYIFGPCQWTSDLPYDGPVFGSSEDYARLFRDKFGKDAEYHSAAATACGVTYQLALEKASSLDREAVRDALVSLDAMTFYGRIKFNEQGRDISNPMVAIQVQRGKRVTVWPEHLATGSAKYPTPPWEEREDELKVAVLHIGPINDYGWTYEAHLGAQAMAEALPYVELSEKEEACGPDTPQIMREYADTGYKVIFCHAWDFGEYIEQVAPNYPDVIFMWGNGVEKKAPNVGIYYGRMYEAKFLVGMVAGAMTKTNKIGYAAGIPIPDVVRGINAFARGVASVNPDAKVYVKWVGEWYNPPKESEVALALIDSGCDVITHHTDSYAPAVVADERGVYYISLNSNLRRFAPHVFLTGAVWNWTPIMTDIVKAVREGTWDEYPGQDWWYGLAEGGVELAPFSDLVPDDVRELVKEKKQAIIEGEFEVFPGMTDDELREIYYFESNVVGELPVREAEKAIKIGAIYPLTGSLATTGTDVKNGILLAVDIINNEYNLDLPLARTKGIDSLDGAKIEIVFGDSQGSPSTGKSEAERLIEEEKVVALTGCYQSAVTAEASQMAEDKGIPFLSATSAAPSLTQRGFNCFFRTTPNDKTFVQSFYDFLQDIQEEKGVKVEKLGIVYENSLWGPEFSKYAEQYAKEYGYQVVENISYYSNTTNVTNEVQRLKNANPDVVMQASYINDAILYMQTYKETKFTPDAILADNAGFIEPEFLQTLGDDGNYILTQATWSKDLAETKPLVGTVNQMFKERYGTDMTGNSARAFTGMLVLADAINRARSTDSEAIREALLETNMPGDKLIMPWGGIRFDHETHQNTLGKGIICQIIDQEYYTVWPWNLATKELIWPMPRWEEREQVR